MKKHDDLDLQPFSIVCLRVFVACLKRDMRNHRARYIHDRWKALRLLEQRLKSSGFNNIAAQGGIVHMAWCKGKKSDEVVKWVLNSRNVRPPYSNNGGKLRRLVPTQERFADEQ
jgi:hypothetical protein